MDIPPAVRSLFAAAGWQSGRRVRVNGRVPRLDRAYDVLKEVGGLQHPMRRFEARQDC